MLKRITQTLTLMLLPALLIIGLLAAAQVARADNHVVTNAGDDGPGSLRLAIAAAADGDTITFNGDYTIYLTSTLTIDKRLTIDGSGHTVKVSGDSSGDGSRNVQVFYIQNTGIATLTHLNIVSGTTPDDGYTCPTYCGGGIYNDGGMLTVQNSTLSGNSASYEGGGIYNVGTLAVITSTLFGNSASIAGGGIKNYYGTLIVQTSIISGNYSGWGGGIDNWGTLTVQTSTISGNSATNADGGGIHNYDGTLTIQNSTLFGNSAVWGDGGGIYNDNATSIVQNSTISSNSANQGSGGIYNGSTLTVQNSIISDNSAEWGGGIYNEYGTLTIQNSTLSGNSATSTSWGGGAIDQNGSSSTALIVNSTIVSNTAASSGGRDGLWLEDGTAIISNTIIAYNDTANCTIDGGTFDGSDHNLTNNTTCPDFATSSPLYLGPLANNGGNTQTHALLPGSAAIDAGNDATCLSTDQRGINRDGACDIGAFESRGFSLAMAGGNNQHTLINTTFAQPLSVTVNSAFEEPVGPGGVIRFIAPSGGASLNPTVLTATTNADEIAGVVVMANNITGSYVVTATTLGVTTPVTFNLTNLFAEIAILGHNVEITNGDTTPSITDDADFGNVALGRAITHTFTISNSGTGDLLLTNSPVVSLTGTGAGSFSVVVQPATTSVSPNITTTFQIRFTPSVTGRRVATVTIANNDNDENPYDFAIQGIGTAVSGVFSYLPVILKNVAP